MSLKRFFRQLIEGIAVGFAFVSGMGGGTVAVLVGIYDDIVDAIADFPKSPGEQIKKAWVWALGIIIGVAALIWPLTKLLELYPFPTITFVAGLTLGGFRELTGVVKGNVNWKNILLMVIGIIVPVVFAVISWFTAGDKGITIEALSFTQVLILIGIGVMLAAAIIAPGISGTQFLISIGYVGPLVLVAKNLFDGVNIGLGIGVFVIIILSIIIGLFLVSKLLQVLLKRWHAPTYFVILGFILGSIFAAFFNGEIKTEYAAFAGNFDWIQLVVCLVMLVSGFFISYFLLGLAQKKSNDAELVASNNSEQENNTGDEGV